MSKNKTITLVIIDTESYVLANVALERTLKSFPINEVLIFSDNPEKWGSFSVIKIDKISSFKEYNHILLSDLPLYLRTDFALIVQFDGFVINPSAFSDFFFNFDYIGAPWPAGWIDKNQGPMVGNGGFSLRSRRLVEALKNLTDDIRFDIPEDITICRFLRPMLEEYHSIDFAPIEVARFFSVELGGSKCNTPFGFHGLQHLPRVYGDNYEFLLDNLPSRCFIPGSQKLLELQRGFSFLGREANTLLSKKIIT